MRHRCKHGEVIGDDIRKSTCKIKAGILPNKMVCSHTWYHRDCKEYVENKNYYKGDVK